jgi:hypothetical protein
MPDADILVSITGMGDPEEGDTDSWAQLLYPNAEMYASGGRKWLQFPTGRQIYLLEVLYEDINDALLGKYEGLRQILSSWAPEQIEKVLNEYAGDVVMQVLTDAAMDATQKRFIAAYAKAIQLSISVMGAGADIRQARVGVLSHSLGTLIAYEGLHRTYEVNDFIRFIPVNLVMCAPMLRPISAVVGYANRRRYLATYGCQRPHRQNSATGKTESLIARCIAFYNRTDPFYRIHADSFYAHGPTRDLVDSLITFETHPKYFWEAHSMGESYLVNNRETIAQLLFSR